MIREHTIEITFEQLERCLEFASGRVPVSDPKQLLDWIEPTSAVARQLILCELIKLDMSQASIAGLNRLLDFYDSSLRREFPDAKWPLDLVLEEIQVQREMGEPPSGAELKKKYPYLADALDGLMTQTRSTSSRNRSSKPDGLAVGERVDDFVILRALGEGAFAKVYLAKQESLHRLVALKVSNHRSDESVVLSQLDHPNIVRVYDQRRIASSNASMLYMQYVPGGTLADVIKRLKQSMQGHKTGEVLLEAVNQALLEAGQQGTDRCESIESIRDQPWAEVVATIGYQLAQGLAHAHSKSVMHRDIKPANILLSREGTPKLADFNVSFVDNVGTHAASHFGGSITYMSPEQLEVVSPQGKHSAETLDGRSDLYSLAIVLWELWQGQRPWRFENSISSWNDAVQKHIMLRAERIETVRHSQTPCELVLERTLRATLSTEPSQRPADGIAMASKLKLAIHPKAARLFEPHPESWQYWTQNRSFYLISALIVFIPNGLAGAINFQFNLLEVQRTHPELREYFGLVSLIVNCVAFSFGAYLLVREIRLIKSAVDRAKNKLVVKKEDLDVTCNLGFRSAVNGAYLWLIAGFIFPLALGWIEPRFRLTESASFFLSIVGCGGMACIYPYFGLTLFSLQVVYPILVSRLMVDPDWKKRQQLLIRRANCFLVAGAIVPLVVLGLLILVPDLHPAFQVICLAMTAVALVVAFITHQHLLGICQVFSEYLSVRSDARETT
jgi:eukaryotic-like serine/threonine-protein kinase